MSINFKHTQSGLVKECPVGFSWTYFFFGPLVGMFRGMWAPFFISAFTFGFANLYFMFVINKMYAETLMERGYEPVSEVDMQMLVSMGMMEFKKPVLAEVSKAS